MLDCNVERLAHDIIGPMITPNNYFINILPNSYPLFMINRYSTHLVHAIFVLLET